MLNFVSVVSCTAIGVTKNRGQPETASLLRGGGGSGLGRSAFLFKKNLDGVLVSICLFGSVALRNTTTVDEKKGFKLNKGQIQT